MGSFSNQDIENAVIYCRVSSEKQVRQGHGLDGQEHRCRDYAKRNGLIVEQVFRDEAISGGIDYRPAFFKLLDYISKSKKPFAVIFDELNRLARDVVVARTLKVEVAKAGGELHCLNFEFEDTPENRLFETLVVATGEFERLKNTERVKARQKARIETGYWTFPAPRGYRYDTLDGMGKVLVPDEPNSSIIKSAFFKYASDELLTQTDVSRYFMDSRLLNRSKKPHKISVEEVKRILTRVLYCGDIEYPKWQIKRRKGKHVALVPKLIFDQVQNKLIEKKRQVYKSDVASDFPLRGLLRCSCCGTTMTASWSKGRNDRYPYYRCPNTQECNANPKSIRKEYVEDEFVELLSNVTPKTGLIKLTRAITEDVLANKEEELLNLTSSRKVEIKDIDKQIERLIDQLEGIKSHNVIGRFEQRIDALEAQKRQLQNEVENAKTALPDTNKAFERVFDFVGRPHSYWEAGNLKQKQMVQNMVFNRALMYSKQDGFGTVELSLPFNVLSKKNRDKNVLVETAGIEPASASPLQTVLHT